MLILLVISSNISTGLTCTDIGRKESSLSLRDQGCFSLRSYFFPLSSVATKAVFESLALQVIQKFKNIVFELDSERIKQLKKLRFF